MEYIEQELSRPHTVGDLFTRKVFTLRASDKLATGLKVMREERFNQFPI